jgi:DNA-binding NtrC family response regulator
MSPQAQAKVLRAIEDGKIERVGSGKKIDVDVRIISATNKELSDEIQKEKFREDLFHRLNVIPINVPPLRERKVDIPILAEAFSKAITTRHKKPTVKFLDDSFKLLQEMNWSGNVRELKNIIERIIIIIDKREIARSDIELLLKPGQATMDDIIDESNSFQEFKEKAERAFILKQLNENNWNISKTAELLDIQRSHLYNKMKKYGIEKGD